jgi:ketosteroid isomerase-like protein
MDARDKLPVAAGPTAGPDLDAVERVFETIARAGVNAGVDELLSSSHEDIEMRAYALQAVGGAGDGNRDALRGRDEIRSFFRQCTDEGFSLVLRTRGFDVDADAVLVRGSIRVARPDGSFAETNVTWRFQFEDGLIRQIGWKQRAGEH